MVHLSAATRRAIGSQVRFEVDVTIRGEAADTLWFQMDEAVAPSPEAVADAFFPIGLLMGMVTDSSLEMTSPVSGRLLDSTEQIQDILLMWHGAKLARTEIQADRRETATEPTTPALGTTACFTGGVDSFFTLLKHQDEVSSLVYVHGFDIPLARIDAYEQTLEHLRTIANDTGKELIEMSTNLNSFVKAVGWGPIAHGPALASIAMLLTRDHGKFLIPATHTYNDMYPWGSHPLLDPLWSTDRVSVIHDGGEATRVRKTVALGENHVAQQHLRVCWKNTGAYNCGVCEKCYRTKICLYLAGTLGHVDTFENSQVDPEVIRKILIRNANALSFAVENRDFAIETGDEVIAQALNDAISRYWRREPRTKQLLSEKKLLISEKKRLRKQLDSLRARKSVRWADALGRLIHPFRQNRSNGSPLPKR